MKLGMNRAYKKAIIYFRPNHCTVCNRDEIELYNQFGKPLNYAKMIMYRGQPDKYTLYPNTVISVCKCKACGTKYMLKYDLRDFFPIPVTYNEYYREAFLDAFYNFWKEREANLEERKKLGDDENWDSYLLDW